MRDVFQYQSKAEPVLVPPITLDQWWAATCQPVIPSDVRRELGWFGAVGVLVFTPDSGCIVRIPNRSNILKKPSLSNIVKAPDRSNIVEQGPCHE